MDVPQKIKDRIAALQAEKEAHERRKELARLSELERQKAIRDLRRARYLELWTAAEEVTTWLEDFCVEQDFVKEALAARYCLRIFVAKFWMGEPIDERNITCWAVIELHKSCELRYVEKHKGHDSSVFSFGKISSYHHMGVRFQLYDHLHPDFLAEFAEAIKSGKVWDYIEESLK